MIKFESVIRVSIISFTSSTESFRKVPWLMEPMYSVWIVLSLELNSEAFLGSDFQRSLM